VLLEELRQRLRWLAGAVTTKETAAASAVGVNAIAIEHLTHLWRYLRTRPPESQAVYHISDAFEHFTSVNRLKLVASRTAR